MGKALQTVRIVLQKELSIKAGSKK